MPSEDRCWGDKVYNYVEAMGLRTYLLFLYFPHVEDLQMDLLPCFVVEELGHADYFNDIWPLPFPGHAPALKTLRLMRSSVTTDVLEEILTVTPNLKNLEYEYLWWTTPEFDWENESFIGVVYPFLDNEQWRKSVPLLQMIKFSLIGDESRPDYQFGNRDLEQEKELQQLCLENGLQFAKCKLMPYGVDEWWVDRGNDFNDSDEDDESEQS
ncbi:hypothetical protein BDV96DRAFT_593046 [Lophiotrema nucula]|uniref:F-box domain-containing protein n=1 Tax=Lophiotrema nucula TaxID=690887 RepID=A0A6A5ZUE1_9PLEO|nr:hypothetical protein BDV96DRAFT_593046 [Lophiotrema nucula]